MAQFRGTRGRTTNMSRRNYASGTFIDTDIFGRHVRARVMCPDGKVRNVARIAAEADTFFSVPAAVRIARKYVRGYVTVGTPSGSDVPMPDDPATVYFRAYLPKS